ncbi:MAG: hypothetical protein KME54_27545 [Tolypothrix brevis GSE-NOS-MK-07-07A]|jgi:hypothetical protein|nr:hypothetical protein [Tolypothrix brevis GSE-NOS-MK-07-07A]
MNPLFLKIEDFYEKLQAGEFDEPLALANILHKLSEMAWNEVEELYQPAIRIEA